MHTPKKTRNKLLTLLIMTDGSSEPKSYKVKVMHVKLFVMGVVFLFASVISLVVYIFLHANKIFDYADLKQRYGYVVEDNKRIKSLENDYLKIKQENQKIRMVFGMLGLKKADSATAGLDNISLAGQLNDGPAELRATGLTDNSNNFLSDRILPTLIPVESQFVTQTFRQNSDENNEAHLGVDIASAVGTPIRSAGEGWVLFADWLPDFGYTIIIHHGSGFFTVYKHAHVLLCRQGKIVRKGEVIATVGKTGTLTTGPHLHFEIWRDGVPINPVSYIPELNEFMDKKEKTTQQKS